MANTTYFLKYSQSGVTLYLFFDTRKINADLKYPLKFCVCSFRQRKYYPTGFSFTETEFLSFSGTKNRELIKLRGIIEEQYLHLKTHIQNIFETHGTFSFAIFDQLTNKITNIDVTSSFQEKIDYLIKEQRINTGDSYRQALNSFTRIFGDKILFEDVTTDWLNSYEKTMLKEGKSPTTIGIYLRYLRSIFNDKIKLGLLNSSFYPFNNYKIPTSKGRKMALTLEHIKAVFQYKPLIENDMQYIDLWKFSYLCNGANLNDILQLKYENIQGNEIYFVRNKTAHSNSQTTEIAVFLTDRLKAIIETYGNVDKNKSKYIFPYLNQFKDTDDKRKKILYIADVIKRINKRMKKVSIELGIEPHITTYTARHSFATVLKRSGANISFISESLGHSSLKTTQSYLASFETEERQKNAELLTSWD